MKRLRKVMARLLGIGRRQLDPAYRIAVRRWVAAERRLRTIESQVADGYRERQ